MIHKDDLKLLEWAKTLKPGELFGACTGFNHYVKEINLKQIKDDDGTVLETYVEILDTNDTLHYCQEFNAGCVVYPYSVEEINKFILSLEQFELQGSFKEMLDKVKNNEPVCDDKGVKL